MAEKPPVWQTRIFFAVALSAIASLIIVGEMGERDLMKLYRFLQLFFWGVGGFLLIAGLIRHAPLSEHRSPVLLLLIGGFVGSPHWGTAIAIPLLFATDLIPGVRSGGTGVGEPPPAAGEDAPAAD